MPFKTQENMDCDVLIVGGGGVGLRAAIAAAEKGANVLMVSKTRVGHATNTFLSKAIIASSGYGDPSDSSDVHSQDTLQGGRYLNNPDMVAQFARAIPSETKRLQDWGVKFGANRLGGNALAEVIAMGALVGNAAAQKAKSCGRVSGFGTAVRHEKVRLDTMFRKQGRGPGNLIQELKKTMWFNAGVIRNQQSLDRALEIVMDQKDVPVLVSIPKNLIQCLEFKNMGLVAELICRSALERTESRGSHFRSDYPEENNQWLKNIQAQKTDTGVMLTKVPVSG